MIPYGQHNITQADTDAVLEVLRSDFLTQGPVVARFEQAVAARVKVKHAVAVNSATSALHIACLALDLGPGDFLWTVPNTFVASANCGLYCGAKVDFVDIDPLTWNISIPRLHEKLLQAKKLHQLPKILVPVHFAGQPTEQKAIWDLAQEFGFKVLEDASHAIGASSYGESVGSCRWSDMTVFSFHPVKIITSGEGGMVLTRDSKLAERMEMLRSHGITRNPELFQNNISGPQNPCGPALWHYEQQLLGFNYRMTDIHAALGMSQLTRLDAYIERRNVLAQRYDQALKDLPLQLPHVATEKKSAFHLYVVQLKLREITKTHRQVFDEMRERNVGVNLHYMPVHLQPYYQALGFKPGQYPEAEKHGVSAITLPLYPTLSDAEQDQVVAALREIL